MSGSEDKTIQLRVTEALPKDVGRGIARLDPQDIEALEATTGDILEVVGKRRAAVKAMPTYLAERGKGVVQIDGIIRENAQVGLDDRVQLRKAEYQNANMVILAPVGQLKAVLREQDRRYILRLLEGLPITAGDLVRVNLFGTQPWDFTVIETSPRAIVVVQSTTNLRIRGEAPKERARAKVSYEDIGGLSKEISRVREMIELPIRFPEIFERLGIDAPKGVLLYGPPGCGKTLIARAVAGETSAHFIHVNGPEVIHKFYGESEAHLRSIFQDAESHAPAIIFLDEIDAIAPKREEVHGEVEKRVVAQLLALMDGLKSRGQVIIIGATNIPNSLDPALRRPGRFDREISISIPDRNGRKDILQIHTRGMPLAADVDLEKLASTTHGFVGADLEALCREAAMNALRTIIPNIDFEHASIPYEKLLELEVTMDNFLSAFKEVEPSAVREVFTEVGDVRWEQVGGLQEVKQILRETIEWPLRYGKLFDYANTTPPKGVMLTGAPGTGKTLIAKAVATESEVNFISVKGPSLLSKWVGESEKGVREVFRKARQASPCIVFFDEIDALVPVRSGGTADSHVTERVVSQFLSEMDGIEDMHGVVILAATNRPDIIDPALLRPGRFDFLIKLPVPDAETRRAIFDVHTRGKPLAPDVDLDSLCQACDGLVGADIEALCRLATMQAIRDYVEQDPDLKKMEEFQISHKHFEAAMSCFTTKVEGPREAETLTIR
ncbi:MAG: CDC48 family AAA ATPase [Bacteroidetes bacterium]|nr:CDC48 family AAA ATPase [Bacteroidota bacterium]